MTTQVRPQTPAARLETTHQILALTQRLAEAFSLESALRDRERRLPDTELHTLFSSGLGGITVPAQFGGADVSCATLAQVVSRLAQADGSIGQVPQIISMPWKFCVSMALRRNNNGYIRRS